MKNVNQLNDEGMINLLEAVILQAREDYYFDIVWLAKHNIEDFNECVKRREELDIELKKLAKARDNPNAYISKYKKVLGNAESSDADREYAATKIEQYRNELAENDLKQKPLRSELRQFEPIFTKCSDIQRIERWITKKEVITVWRALALERYLSDLRLSPEKLTEAKNKLREDTRDLGTVFRDIRNEFARSV